MADFNRILSYLTISLILLIGIALVSGLIGDIDSRYRVGIGIIVGIYVVVRVWLMSVRSRSGSMMRYRGKVKDD